MNKRSTLTLYLLLSALLLSSCTSGPSLTRNENRNPNAGRYEMANDSAELEPIDVSTIQLVTPRIEPRTSAGNKSPYTINGKTYYVRDTEAGYKAEGGASWYGRKFHGHLTSNGEIYDMFELSAAHKTLPIPSFARVTNLDNGKSIVVRVNDRGPFHEGRIIDLSYAAATMLDYAHLGTANVRVEAIVPGQQVAMNDQITQEIPLPGEPVSEPISEIIRESQVETVFAEESAVSAEDIIDVSQGSSEALDYLQVGAFSSEEGAIGMVNRLSAITDLPVFIRTEASQTGGSFLHRVRLGPLTDAVDLDLLKNMIIEAGLGTPFRVGR